MVHNLLGCTNVKFVGGPVSHQEGMVEVDFIHLPDNLKHCFKIADLSLWNFCRRQGRPWTLNYVENRIFRHLLVPVPEESCPSLQVLAARAFSGHHWCFGTANGRPYSVSALSGIREKGPYLLTKLFRNTREINPALQEALSFVPEALKWLTHILGVKKYFGTVDPTPNLSNLSTMGLSSSSGLLDTEPQVVFSNKQKIKITAVGKKFHSLEAVINGVTRFLSGGDPLETFYIKHFKSEIYTSFTAQWDDGKWANFTGKSRIFEMPNAFFLAMEMLYHGPRSKYERSRSSIKIGFSYSHGGVDHLARMFGVYDGQGSVQLGDGDIDKLDQSIHNVFINIFESFGLLYFDKTHPAYPQMDRIRRYILERVTARLTHFTGRLWGIIVGQMPSGRWMTSHGDSWIMLLWFCLFCVMQMTFMPVKLMRQFTKDFFLLKVGVALYGDDHVLFNDRKYSVYINEFLWMAWCQKYLGVKSKDVRNDIPFLSTVSGGMIQHKGLVFLQMFFVCNQNKTPGQCKYLPYRDIRTMMVKAAHGREPKTRDAVDILGSCIGLAYGTFASNPYTYVWLQALYATVFSTLSSVEQSSYMETYCRRLAEDPVNRSRGSAKGVSLEDLRKGFPTFAMLEEKNIWDEAFHSYPVDSQNVYDIVF